MTKSNMYTYSQRSIQIGAYHSRSNRYISHEGICDAVDMQESILYRKCVQLIIILCKRIEADLDERRPLCGG